MCFTPCEDRPGCFNICRAELGSWFLGLKFGCEKPGRHEKWKLLKCLVKLFFLIFSKKKKGLHNETSHSELHPAVNLEHAVYNPGQDDSTNACEKWHQISSASDINTERRGRERKEHGGSKASGKHTNSFCRQLPAGSPFTGRLGGGAGCSDKHRKKKQKTYLASLFSICRPLQAAGADADFYRNRCDKSPS